uniref:Uncharacterized protein n=1 Tax=Hyaloperonospora arabidopsidis (strain Emoy2) TaxID=559515 RepID=M4B5T3_HYAAE
MVRARGESYCTWSCCWCCWTGRLSCATTSGLVAAGRGTPSRRARHCRHRRYRNRTAWQRQQQQLLGLAECYEKAEA